MRQVLRFGRAHERPLLPGHLTDRVSGDGVLGPSGAVSASSLAPLAEYARASAAAGGFDREDAQLRRALVKLDARGEDVPAAVELRWRSPE